MVAARSAGRVTVTSGWRFVALLVTMTLAAGCGAEGGPSPSPSPERTGAPSTTVPGVAPTTDATAGTESGPAARGYHAIVDVPGDLGVMLISGSARPPANFFGDTWAFAPDRGWSDLAPDPVVAVTDHAAFDEASGRVFAGVGETWLYEPGAGSWDRLALAGPAFEPGSRSAYDSQSDRIVLYSADGSTWALDLDAEAWQRMAPSVTPPARGWGAMAYDAEADRIVLFGGIGAGDVHLADTWAYDVDTDTWSRVETGTTPARRTYAAMTYDPVGQRLLLFGGANGAWEAETVLDDQWSFDLEAAAWTELTPASRPPARGWHAMAFDAESGLIVLFGGGPDRRSYTAETWLYDPVANTWSEWPPG
jgi:hypothetical protein